MNEPPHYTIGHVALQTGLKPHILRTWERRYGVVKPRRTATNRRAYTGDDVYRLNLVKRAVSAGHSVSHVAKLSNEDLIALDQQMEHRRSIGAEPEGEVEIKFEQYISEALHHVMRLDPRSLEETLGSAAVGLTRPQLLNGLVQPLFEKIGRLWASGRLKIIHEHMASIVTRSFLLDILRTIVVADTSPKIVVGTPVGQWHETGALIVALTAAESGWRPLYFGPNLPAEEIAAAAQITASKAIALSISHRIELEIVVRELSKLRRYCDRQISIYVGGYGISDLKPRVYRRDIRCIESVEDFRSRLEGVC